MPNHPKYSSLEERLLAGVVCVIGTRCWEYTGVRNKGYGQLKLNVLQSVRTHRVAYELYVGPLTPDIELHHTCGNRACCNPDHLTPLSDIEHKRADPNWAGNKTHCKRGHPLDGDNLLPGPLAKNGLRVCRACSLLRAQRYRTRNLFAVRKRVAEHNRKKYAETHKPVRSSRYRKS